LSVASRSMPSFQREGPLARANVSCFSPLVGATFQGASLFSGINMNIFFPIKCARFQLFNFGCNLLSFKRSVPLARAHASGECRFLYRDSFTLRFHSTMTLWSKQSGLRTGTARRFGNTDACRLSDVTLCVKPFNANTRYRTACVCVDTRRSTCVPAEIAESKDGRPDSARQLSRVAQSKDRFDATCNTA
jgi:hypothetical protein